jgi:hypothetical protein
MLILLNLNKVFTSIRIIITTISIKFDSKIISLLFFVILLLN